MIRLYMDEQIPRAITVGLRLRQVDTLTAQEDGRAGTPDPDLLDRASELGRVMVSFDSDMIREAGERGRLGLPFPGVVHVHPMRMGLGHIVRELELLAKAGNERELVNRVLYLPL